MQVTQRQQLNLFDSFFDEELDYKNDLVSYINVGFNSSVTPKDNNNIFFQSKKHHRHVNNIFDYFICPVLNNPCFEFLFYIDFNLNIYSFNVSDKDIFIQYELAKDFSILDSRIL